MKRFRSIILILGLLGSAPGVSLLEGASNVPGVRVEELGLGPRPIRGVDMARCAFVGTTAQGPQGQPRSIASLVEFRSLFGTGAGGAAMDRALRLYFANGGQRATVLAVSEGALPGNARKGTGLYALARLPDFRTLCLPACRSAAVWSAAVAYCEARRIILIPDLPAELRSATAAADWLREEGAVLRSENVAAYLPGLGTGSPAAAVAGLISRFDRERGCWKSPAGVEAVLRDTGALLCTLGNAEADRLGTLGVNALRWMTGRGVVTWGARTLSTDPEWRYLPVRRLALYLEESIEGGTSWVRRQPNDARLWASAQASVAAFLAETWRKGAFQGARPAEAYFVRCDRSTMTDADRRAGRFVMEVGFAPQRPAEFVVFTIRQQIGAPRPTRKKTRRTR